MSSMHMKTENSLTTLKGPSMSSVRISWEWQVDL